MSASTSDPDLELLSKYRDADGPLSERLAAFATAHRKRFPVYSDAVDKLVGAMARAGASLAQGFLFSTARCSYEIVEKAVKAGVTTLVTISLPTSLAVARARMAGLSLWVLARGDSVICVTSR